LTTVSQSPVDLARRAMTLLIERIRRAKNAVQEPAAKIMLPTQLVIRESCGVHPIA
jgi:DNA-binding LacI/PurR family transcriptional regulator